MGKHFQTYKTYSYYIIKVRPVTDVSCIIVRGILNTNRYNIYPFRYWPIIIKPTKFIHITSLKLGQSPMYVEQTVAPAVDMIYIHIHGAGANGHWNSNLQNLFIIYQLKVWYQANTTSGFIITRISPIIYNIFYWVWVWLTSNIRYNPWIEFNKFSHITSLKIGPWPMYSFLGDPPR